MKHILLLCGFFISQPLLMGVEISVGGTRLSIPPPDGYAPITSDMPYAEFAKRFVPPMNEQFALFLSDADIASAARGEIPKSERRFYVQTAKKIVQPFVSTADFAELKRTIKTQNDEALKKAQAQMPGFLEKANKGIADDYNVDLNLSLDQMLPLPPHYETERGLAYSMILKYKANDQNGKPVVFEGVVTATFVHLQGKVLFLYANAEKSALEWCRAESKKWADTIIAANPSTGDVALRESTAGRSGVDWGKVFGKALAGAVAGGIIGAVLYLFRKKKG